MSSTDFASIGAIGGMTGRRIRVIFASAARDGPDVEPPSAGGPVGERQSARSRRLRVDERQLADLSVVAEQPLAAAEHDREDPERQLVDEVVIEQPLDELAAAEDRDVVARAVFQLADLLGQVAAQERRVPPRDVLVAERSRGDVLLDA